MPPAPTATAEPSAATSADVMPSKVGPASRWHPAISWQAVVVAAFLLLGQLPLLLKLLSPAGRPAQITRDLVSFWNRGYHEVKKDLKGRYPKHYWPDDPYTAAPTRRARPRR